METTMTKPGEGLMKPVVLYVRGDEWRLSIRGVTRAGGDLLVELALVGPRVCTAVVRTPKIVRGETAQRILEAVCEWLLRRGAGEDHALLEVAVAAA
jgi:hypothetical protein